ncbi:hypothetical protein Cni_G18192 [Canna indica]|uniref:OCEL domain-containing protein n=1 Tax=Canna indica TaxID=4628 RepID=A0AAQ3KIX8_9LILI|nr:hypothetical protein Cni_G18192 [Canna indica]
MFKLGRGAGAGRGNGKRPLPPPSSTALHRPATAPGRLPIGASPASARGRPGGTPAAPCPPAREESFSLESGGGLPNFAAIIRLTPDLVDEIRRLEAQGGAARIKFDSNLNNIPGNVIDVGGKEFRFTWSRELGDLCDIYEEHQSGENGNGLLVESGSAWRKLTVQRILDESTKNHVKMRSEEAERLSKSRKAIVLDPANPSVKNQAKSMVAAAVEGNMRRMGWKNKEFFKKRKENQVSNIGPSRSVMKSATASNNTKGRPSVSPLPSPPEQHIPGSSAPSFGIGASSRGDSHNDDSIAPSNLNKEEIGNFEKEIPSRVLNSVKPNAIGLADQTSDQSLNLRRLLITVLSENPKGMSLKALEKTVGEMMPNSVKKIESIIKHIATYQAPGKYVLKPGVELESSNLRTPESGSSPENSNEHASAVDRIQEEKATNEKIEQQSNSDINVEEELDILGNIDTARSSLEHFVGDLKVSNDSQGQACSSSDSGSDSDSDSESSGSGSDSGSQSKASSSDSDSDGSSSSKEGSDVDVDIMSSDNEREVVVHKPMEMETIFPSSPGAGIMCHDEHERNDVIIDQECQVSPPAIDLNDSERMDVLTEVIEPSKCFPLNRRNEVLENPETEENFQITEKVCSSPYDGMQSEGKQISFANYSLNDVNEKVLKSSNNERQTIPKDKFPRELSDSSGKLTKQKSKRTRNSDYSEGRTEGVKRAKDASSAQVMSSRNIDDSTLLANRQHDSPEQPKHVGYKDHVMQSESILPGGKNADSDSQERSPVTRGRSLTSGNLHRTHPSPDVSSGLEAEHSGSKTGDFNRKKGTESTEKPNRSIERTGNRYAEISRDNLHGRDSSSTFKEKMQKDIRNINSDVRERCLGKNVGDIGGDKHSAFRESSQTKPPEHLSTTKVNGQQFGKQKFDAEKSLIVGSKGHIRRELSDLELGELRETPKDGEDYTEVKRQLDRKSSFKTLANDVTNLEINKGRSCTNLDVEISKGRVAMNASRGSKNQSPPSPRGGGQGNHGPQRKEPADSFSDFAKPQLKSMYSHNEPLPRLDHADSEAACWDMSAETIGRTEKRMGQRISQESHSGLHKKNHASLPPHIDNMTDQGGQRNGELMQKSNASEHSRNNILRVKDSNDRNMRDSSSDEDNSFYSKYDKDEPELKGPIKDLSQYKQYVQEFREKYEVYCDLNKNLEKIRNDFLQVGNDLEIAEERDVKEYYNVVEKLREMYLHCRERNKRMKKVFILLHEELKNLKQRIKSFAEDYTNE